MQAVSQQIKEPIMETIAFKTGMFVFTMLGIPSALFTVLLYWGTWKADIIFALSAIFFVIRIGFMIKKQLDESDARQIENDRNRWELEQKKKRNQQNQ